MIEIRARQPVLSPGTAPTFLVTTDRPWCEVQAAREPLLLSRALASRRAPNRNFATSGRLRVAPGQERAVELAGGAELLRPPALYYRALAYDSNAPAAPVREASVPEGAVERAPFVYLDPRGPVGARPVARLSGRLPRLVVDGNRLRDPGGSTVVLRGVNRAELDVAEPGALDHQGNPQVSARAAAGITHEELRALADEWRVNVVRLPVSQDWALDRPGYLFDIDDAVALAADAGVYTLLALDLFGVGRRFGQDDEGRANPYPAFPDENTVRCWDLLGRRYAPEPAVLFEPFGKPHEPLPGDTQFRFERPRNEDGWVRILLAWARRLADTVHRWDPGAVVLVSGWRWGLDLRRLVDAQPGPATGYAVHASAAATPDGAGDFETWFGPERLRLAAPVLVAEWGGQTAAELAWCRRLERYLRERHARGGADRGRGVAGWTIWSWPEPPPLARMTTRTRTIEGRQRRYRAFVFGADGQPAPTNLGGEARSWLRAGLAAPPGLVVGRAGQPATPRLPTLVITRGVGAGQDNRPGDVRAVQQRLRELRYLADDGAETPGPEAAGLVADGSLPRTIAAIQTLQQDLLGQADGVVSPRGRTLAALNRAIARPAAEDFAAVRAARATIPVAVADRQGAAITQRVGSVPDAAVQNGEANLLADVVAVQQRLQELGHLAANHGEQPAADPASRLRARLPRTIAAIRAFQQAEDITWWRRWAQGQAPQFAAFTDRVVAPGDATHMVLDGLRTHLLAMPDLPSVRERNFVRAGAAATPITRYQYGISYVGSRLPNALPRADYAAMGLTAVQTAALQHVSAHEARFDGLNTYDVAMVSVGFIQFAGGSRGLEPCLAVMKWRAPEAFAERLQRFGVDVEYTVRDGDITDNAPDQPVVVVYPPGDDPAPDTVLRGVAAERSIRNTPLLWSVLVRAGRDRELQLAQIEAATRYYVLRSLAQPARWNGTSRPLRELLNSSRGTAILIDRAIQEGARDRAAGTVRVVAAMRKVADRDGLTDIADVRQREAAVIVQVRDDLAADRDIARSVQAAQAGLDVLLRRCDQAGATPATVLARPESAVPRTRVDEALGRVDDKSLPTNVPAGSWLADPEALRAGLTGQRDQLALDPANPPVNTVPALRQFLRARRTALGRLVVYAANAATVLRRVQDIVDAPDLQGP